MLFGYWLIQQDVMNEMRRLRALGLVPTAQQQSDFMALRQAEAAANTPRNLTVAGDVAEIRVEGVLTPKPDFWMWLFYGANTSYEDIQAAFSTAKADPNVKRAILRVASPGGTVEGLFETLAVMQDFGKPLSAKSSLAASAAYALASQADSIMASSPAAQFGSIGVVQSFYIDPEIVDITSTEAPNKRPDVTTEEGKAVVRAELDALHELFAQAIANGRTTATGQRFTVKQINAEFGRGSVLVAEDAKAVGMIDGFPKLRVVKKAAAEAAEAATEGSSEEAPKEVTPSAIPNKDASAANGGAAKRKKTMNREELQAQHPQLFAALLEEGKASGEKAERDRVCAHLELGKQSGAMDVAIAAIGSGEGMTQTITAKYLGASMNRADQNARQRDSNAAGEAVGGAAGTSTDATTTQADLGDQIADRLEAKLGITKKKSA